MNEAQEILAFLIRYGYWLAVPIMILEGPLITIAMGFLCSLGFFNIFLVIALGAVSDLISDSIYYLSGYHGGPKVLARLELPQTDDNQTLQKLKDRFNEHPFQIFFGAKVLTGIAHSTFVLSGVTHVNYGKILKYSIPGGLLWSTGLALLGFYFGENTTSIGKFLSASGLALFSLLLAFLVYKFWFGKYIARKFAVWKEKYNHQDNGEV